MTDLRSAAMDVIDAIDGLDTPIDHEVYEATDAEPEECTDDCPACAVDRLRLAVASTDEEASMWRATANDLLGVIWPLMTKRQRTAYEESGTLPVLPSVAQVAAIALTEAADAWEAEYEERTAAVGAYGQKKVRAALVLASGYARARANALTAEGAEHECAQHMDDYCKCPRPVLNGASDV